MVVFEDGMPRKSEYRRFIIKGFEGSDDFAAMHEVLSRRLRRLVEDRDAMAKAQTPDGDVGSLIDPTTGAPRKFAYAPHLIVVDGGAPQVHAAQEVLEEFGLEDEIALCGLAKRLEEVWLPDEEWPVILPRTSEGLYLLQRLRDEAHRFAITFHRSKRSKAMVESVLDGVSGLGETRRKALLSHFGSVRALRKATVEDIAEIPGFGPKLAGEVVAALSKDKPGEAINTATGEVADWLMPITALPLSREHRTDDQDPASCHHLRHLRCWPSYRGPCHGGPGLVRRRQPAPGDVGGACRRDRR